MAQIKLFLKGWSSIPYKASFELHFWDLFSVVLTYVTNEVGWALAVTFVKLSPKAITLRNNILMSSSFIAVVSTF